MNIVILAAGMGKRMHSNLPKVLHPLAGKALLSHVVDTAKTLSPTQIIVVYGHGGDVVKDAYANQNLSFALQEPQLGTGHAVMQAIPLLKDEEPTLILYGDVPLISAVTLKRLMALAGNQALGILTARVPNPFGFGRMVRKNGKIMRIVEHKDATEEELLIDEINTGIMVAPTQKLKTWLKNLSNNNAQKEYYLTDIVEKALNEEVQIVSAEPDAIWETLGINNKKQLAELERIYQRNMADALMEKGVTLADPARLDVRGELTCGKDVFIDVGCVFEGVVHIGDNVTVGAHSCIKDATISSNATIRPFCHIEGASVGDGSIIGPYARLRPGTTLESDVHIGNFVEIKNSHVFSQSKANHLAYVGDSTVGARVNIGAGAITCNYDGANKHKTVIHDDVFIGTNCELVAPVTVGEGATVGAGTTLTKDVPAGSLTVSRSKQTTIADWKRPTKKQS